MCAAGRETTVIYPRGGVAGCELRSDVLGNFRDVDFDFRRIWLGETADQFRATVGQVDVCRGCYHHCFISPALFRSPQMWPKMVAAAWDVYEQSGRA
jgi:hypothetical protein